METSQSRNLISISKSDSRFDSYLRGTFSKSEIALPVKSMNINTASETVTFDIVSRSAIVKPSFWLLASVRSYLLFLVFIPLLVVSIESLKTRSLDEVYLLVAVLGLLFGSISVSFQNEYSDHMLGTDRIHAESGRGFIRMGWMNAQQALRVSWFFGGLAFLAAVFFGVFNSLTIAPIAVSGVLVLLSQFLRRWSFKTNLFSEIAAVVVLGPILWWGLSMALTMKFQLKFLLIGFGWGLLAMFLLSLRNFRDLVATHLAKYKTLVHLLGFEKSKRFLMVLCATVAALNFFQLSWVTHNNSVYIGCCLALAAGVGVFLFYLRRSVSPAGEYHQRCYRLGYYFFLLNCYCWLVNDAWGLIEGIL